jgi:hypothetical protein
MLFPGKEIKNFSDCEVLNKPIQVYSTNQTKPIKYILKFASRVANNPLDLHSALLLDYCDILATKRVGKHKRGSTLYALRQKK